MIRGLPAAPMLYSTPHVLLGFVSHRAAMGYYHYIPRLISSYKTSDGLDTVMAMMGGRVRTGPRFEKTKPE